MRRGQTARRGRGRGNYQATTTERERESALLRLGNIRGPTKSNTDRNPRRPGSDYKRNYKDGRGQSYGSNIVTLAADEARIKLLTRKFLRTYYEIFDRPNRATLELHYSEDAFFSISSTHPMPLIHFGRNLLVVREPDPRISMLFVGRPKVAEVLATLTPTEHTVENLTIDVPYYTANPMAVTCLQIVVTGLFKDTSLITDSLRAFTRIFVLKHVSTDTQGELVYQIFNDMFMVQEPTKEQIKKHLTVQRTKELRSSQQNQQQAVNTSSTSGSTPYRDSKEEQKITMIMSRTGMNREGSTKLLTDCNWDVERSAETFERLLRMPQSEMVIPKEFFTK